jgi:hypothetical protein
MAEIASNTSYSNSSNVLKMIAEEFKQFRASDPIKSNIVNFISIGGSNEARQVLEPNVFHAWDPVDWCVKCAIIFEAFICNMWYKKLRLGNVIELMLNITFFTN